jgi:hypothetical protein
MPLLWRRIAWFASLFIAAVLALWMRSAGYDWLATLASAAMVWIVLSFVISQLFAARVLGRVRGYVSGTDGLTDRMTDAVKGLPPEEQEKTARRKIDESLR